MRWETTSKILSGHCILKRYTKNIYRLTLFNYDVKPAGFEDDRKKNLTRDVNAEKLENNISRTRSMIYEYAICNDFDYFCTITLDPKRYDRFNLQKYIDDLGQWIRNQRKSTGADIQYLLIPELHKDGAYHMHGLLKGVEEKDLEHFSKKRTIPKNIFKMLKAGRHIYDWLPYSRKFGFCTLEKIRDRSAISKYITKYIKKDVGLAVKDKNKKSYYCSRGLKKAEVLKKGTFPTKAGEVLQESYRNDYVTIFDLNFEDAAYILQYIIDPDDIIPEKNKITAGV